MPYSNGQYVSPGSSSSGSGGGGGGLGSSSSLFSAPKKKKKKQDSGGGFLGTGVGPSISDLADEAVKGVEGVGKDFVGLSSMVGQTASDITWAARHTLSGDDSAARRDLGIDPTYNSKGQYVPRGIGTIGAAVVGMGNSFAGTAADIADITTPDIGPVDVGGWIRSGAQALDTQAAKAVTSSDKGHQQAAEEVGKELRPQTFGKRAEERGFLSPLVEDIGNVALVGGALTKGAGLAGALKTGAGLEDFHPLRFSPEAMAADTANATEAGGAIAKVGEVGAELHHPLKHGYERTVGEVTAAQDARNLRRSAPVDPLLDAYRESQGLGPADEGVVQQARTLNPKRSAKMSAEYENRPGIDSSGPGGSIVDNISPEDRAALDARTTEEGNIYNWLQDEGHVKFDVVPAAENPYYQQSMGTEVGWEPGKQMDIEAHQAAVNKDITENGHMYVDETGSFGEQISPGVTPEQNNIRRAVHDFLGHRRGSPADYSQAGENLAYGNESAWFSPEAQRSVGFDQLGLTAYLDQHGAFPGEQRVGALPGKMADPEYLAGAAPWARNLVDRFNPEGVVAKVLDRLSGVEKSFATKGRARDLAILTEAERNKLAHDPAVTTSIEGARYLVDNFGIKAEAANPVIHDILKDRITGREAQFQAIADADPTLKPYLEDAGWVPEETKIKNAIDGQDMTPEQAAEFGGIMDQAHGAWNEVLAKRVDMLAASRPGLKGLEDVGREEVFMTKKQIRQAKEIKAIYNEAESLRTSSKKNGVIAETERALKDIGRHEATIQTEKARLDAEVQSQQGNVEKLFNERTWKAKGFKGSKWTDKTVPAIVARLFETGGFTWNPYDDQFISAQWAPEGETPLPAGVREVPGEGYSVSVQPRLGEDPKSTFEIPVAQATPELVSGLLDRMKGYAPLFENPDMSIGGWIDNDTGMLHLDLAQTTIDGTPISRQQAMLLGRARNQISVTDMGSDVENFTPPGGSIRIARQMMTAPEADLAARDRVGGQVYEGIARTDENGNALYPELTVEDGDALMNQLDYNAWTLHRSHPDQYPTPASAYHDMEFRFAKDASRIKANPNRSYQTYLGAQLNTQLWENVKASVKDWDTKVAPWYHKSHDFIDKHFGGKEVTLLDGSKRPADEFFTDILAVLSVAADPGSNLKYALTSHDNLADFLKGNDYNVERVQKMVDEMMSVAPDKRTGTHIFKELTRDSHLYPSPKRPLFEIMNGAKLDDMTPDYFAEVPQEMWGSGAKSVTKDMRAAEAEGGEQASMEHGGSRFYAKIKSFKDNLADPANSTSVTLDSWMARLFGEKDWMAAGTYRQYADQMREFAAQVSEREGREVKPHELQAVLWAYAKQEIGRIDAGVLRNQVQGVMASIDDGTWSPDNDHVLAGFDADQAQLDRAVGRIEHGRSRTARQNELATEWNKGGVIKWGDVPKDVQDRIKAQVTEELGAKQPGAYLQETAPVEVTRSDRPGPETIDRTTAITRPIGGAGGTAKETQAEYLARNLAVYDEVATKAYELFQAGDKDGAKQVIHAWSAKKLAKMEASANEFGDFEDVVSGASEGLSDAMARHGMVPNDLYQMYNREVRGAYLMNDDGSSLTHFFQTADPTTFTHEGAHMLRRFLSDEDLHAIEMNMGMKRGERWTPGREEQFANTMTAWMATDAVPEGLRPTMQRLKATLAHGYDEFNRRYNAGRINPEMDGLFRQWFSDTTIPDITSEVAMRGRASNIRVNPDSGNLLLDAASPKGGAMAAGVAPNLETVSAPEAYRTGARATRLREEIRRSDERIVTGERAIARATKARDALRKTLDEGSLPSQRTADRLESQAVSRQGKLDAAIAATPSRRWPREYRPIGEALDQLTAEAKDNPELAQVLEDVGVNFPAVLDRAKELGMEPEHIRDFTEGQVKKLIYDTIRLGDVGKLGKEAEAGTRKAYTGTLAREGKAARSIEALAASIVEVHHELRTNQLVDYIETSVAVPWQGGAELPHNYVEWDPIRNRMTGKEGEATSSGGRYIVPKQVDTVLKRMNQDFNHGLFRGLSKVTNPWRAMILTLSPRWYVNNFVGNAVLATLSGVRLGDWHQALDSFRNKDAGGRYADVPAVQGHSFVSDMGERNIVPTKGVREAWDTGEGVTNKIGRARRQIGHNLRRANEVVDELARSAVYHKTIRVGGTEEAAVIAAQKGLIDYGNLSPFEQQVVRSVVPFYAWQKNILKIVARMPIDHPVAAGFMMQLGALQNDINHDRWGELPLGYAGLFSTGEGGMKGGSINTRGFNPLADSLSLTTPEGIAGSVNPFADIAIRKALGAPDGGFVEQRALSQYGTAVPDVPVGSALGDIGAGIPGFQLGQAATGGGDHGIGQQSLKFVGLNYLTADDIKRVVERTKAAEAQVKANAPFPARKKKSIPGGLTKAIL